MVETKAQFPLIYGIFSLNSMASDYVAAPQTEKMHGPKKSFQGRARVPLPK